MLVKAFIFDMDGLLVETESIHIKTFDEFLRRKGITPSAGYTETLVGFSIAENIEALKRDLGLAGESAALGRERNDLYVEILKKEEIEPLPGVAEILDFAVRHGVKRAVCSSSERRQLDVVLPRLLAGLGRRDRPQEFFDAIIYGDGTRRPKPAPDLYLACAEKLALAPVECLAFEDSLAGVQAAAAAGMPVVAVPNQYSRKAGKWPTPYVAASLSEVLSAGIVTAAGGGFAAVGRG